LVTFTFVIEMNVAIKNLDGVVNFPLINTPKCVLVHSRLHQILSEFGHFYHGEIGQPLNERGPIAMYSELIH